MKWSFLALAGLLASTALADEALDATNLDLLRERAGTDVAVQGEVFSVGKTADGGITFLNIGAGKKEGFVAVVFRDNYGAFPDGFEHFRARTVVVTGALELYRSEQPQIVLRNPEQIRIVEEGN